jgi:hypothetical protein
MVNKKFRTFLIIVIISTLAMSVSAQDMAENPYMKETPAIPVKESDWEAGAGTLEFIDGYAILTGSENAGGYLVGRAYYKREFSGFPHYEVSVTFGRLDRAYGHPMELFFLGGAFAIAEGGSFYFWEHDGHQFSGWKRSNAITLGSLNTLTLRHIGRDITGYINGVQVGTFQLKRPVRDKRISIYMKGNLHGEPAIVFTNFIVSDIETEPEAENMTESDADEGEEPGEGTGEMEGTESITTQ